MNSAYKELICTPKQIADACGMSVKNLRKTYVKTDSDPKEDKQGMLECMDIGTYCLINGVSSGELKILATLSKELKQQILNKMTKVEL